MWNAWVHHLIMLHAKKVSKLVCKKLEFSNSVGRLGTIVGKVLKQTGIVHNHIYHNIPTVHCVVFKHNAILIVLATVIYMVVHYSSLFQYFFYQSTMVSTLVVNSNYFFEICHEKSDCIVKGGTIKL